MSIFSQRKEVNTVGQLRRTSPSFRIYCPSIQFTFLGGNVYKYPHIIRDTNTDKFCSFSFLSMSRNLSCLQIDIHHTKVFSQVK